MKVWNVAALAMFVFALIVATGVSFVTTWQVWFTAGVIAALVGRYES